MRQVLIRRAAGFIFAVLLSSSTQCASLADGPKEGIAPPLVIEQRVPHPADEVYQAWVQNFFETEEAWRFKSREDFYEILETTKLDRALKEKLKDLYRDEFSQEKRNKAKDLYQLGALGGHVLVPPEIREAIPRHLVAKVYDYQFKTFRSKPPLYFETGSFAEAEAFLDQHHFSATAKAKILNNTVQLGGKIYILVTPHVWADFPVELRKQLIEEKLLPGLGNRGVRAQLVLHQGEDLASVAKKYAGDRDYRPIERYLRRVLGNKNEVQLPLEKILPPFIRKMIDSYQVCNGPNCFNSSLNVNRGRESRVEFSGLEPTLNELYSSYRFVKPSEELLVGDLLVYEGVFGNVIHASSYVGDDFIFTKNGLTRFQPYVFQRIEDNERYYFPSNRFRLIVYRKVRPGEAPIGSNSADKVSEVVYRTRSTLKSNGPETKFKSMKNRAFQCLLRRLDLLVHPKQGPF